MLRGEARVSGQLLGWGKRVRDGIRTVEIAFEDSEDYVEAGLDLFVVLDQVYQGVGLGQLGKYLPEDIRPHLLQTVLQSNPTIMPNQQLQRLLKCNQINRRLLQHKEPDRGTYDLPVLDKVRLRRLLLWLKDSELKDGVVVGGL